MKRILLSTLAVMALASCSSTPLEKASLEYKVFPKIANFKYEFNLAIPQASDARDSGFILDNDDYFAENITKSLSNILYEEIRATNGFNTVALLNNPIEFNPTSSTIQNVRRTVGKDAIMLTQINKFNANVRKLSDQDQSNFVNLTVFTNITYKLILTDSESVIFLTTKDTTSSKVVQLNDDFYKSVNEIAIKNIKNNIVEAKNDFILTTKGTVNGDYKNSPAEGKVLKVEKEFDRTQAEKEKAAAELAKEQEEARLQKIEDEKAAAELAKKQEEALKEEPVTSAEPVTEESTANTEEPLTTEETDVENTTKANTTNIENAKEETISSPETNVDEVTKADKTVTTEPKKTAEVKETVTTNNVEVAPTEVTTETATEVETNAVSTTK